MKNDDSCPSPGEAKPSKRACTPAQAEASRRNGARSMGPVTPEGKARSSQNALQHGLLARKSWAPGSPEQRQYQALVEELTAEFEPQTISQVLTVEMLATDLVRMGAAEEYRRRLAELDAPADDSALQARHATEKLEEQIRAVDAIDDKLQSLGRMEVGEADTAWLAELVAQRLARLEEDGRAFKARSAKELSGDEEKMLQVYTAIAPESLGIPRTPASELRAGTAGKVGDDRAAGQELLFKFDVAAIEARLRSSEELQESLRFRWRYILHIVRYKLHHALAWNQRRAVVPPAMRRREFNRLGKTLKVLDLVQRYETPHRRNIIKGLAFMEECRRRRLAEKDDGDQAERAPGQSSTACIPHPRVSTDNSAAGAG